MTNIESYLETQARHQYAVADSSGHGAKRGTRCVKRWVSEPSSETPMEDSIIDFEEAARIIRCLTPMQREIAEMKADRHSIIEIGKALGISAADVEKELSKARKNIRRYARDLVGRAA